MHGHNKKLYGTGTVGTKGQIVIPALAREEMNIKEGDRLYVIGSCHEGMVVMLKEEVVEQFIEKMNLQIEVFKSIKKQKK